MALCAGPAAAALPHHDRLRPRRGSHGGHQAAGVPRSLQVKADGPDLIVERQVFQEIGRPQVAGIAYADALAEPQALDDAVFQDLAHDPAALHHQPNRSQGGHDTERPVWYAVSRMAHPEAVGPDDAKAPLAGDPGHLPLRPGPLRLPGLREPRGVELDALDPLLGALAQQLKHGGPGHTRDHQVDGPGNGRQARPYPVTVGTPFPLVHGPDPALEAAGQEAGKPRARAPGTRHWRRRPPR